jgi:hypothetical protein
VADGPSVQSDLWQYYQTQAPGKVILLGPDVYDGTTAQLAGFQYNTGATYPLLLYAHLGQGGNLWDEYADKDNYVVLDQNNVVRFNARLQGYAWGNSLDLPRIRGVVDSLLANPPASVGDSRLAAPRIDAMPSPFVADVRIAWTLPAASHARASLAIFDPAGRRVATLFEGVPGGARIEAAWDGRDAAGAPLAAGVYLVRATCGGATWARRIVKLR